MTTEPEYADRMTAQAPIRVLFLLDVLNIVGGTEKQLRALIHHMDRTRFDPIVLTLYSMDMPHEAEFGALGCPTRCLGIRKLMSASILGVVYKLVSEIRRERIDIVQTFFPDAGILGTVAGRLGGARVVIGRRDLGYWYTPRYLQVLRLLQRFAHAYLVNSRAVKNVVVHAEKVNSSRVHVIHNGFFESSVSPSLLTAASLGFPSDAKIVGIVANLRPIKRLDRFIEMASAIGDSQTCFLIVGYGELHDDLVEQARLAGIGDRFRIVQAIEKVLEIVKLFTVAVLTSEAEGLSNALVEYGFAGVPAVAFDVGGNRDVIDDEASGFLVEPYNVEALTQRVDSLLNDDALRNRMGARARVVCANRFGGARMVEETQAFYERLVGQAQ